MGLPVWEVAFRKNLLGTSTFSIIFDPHLPRPRCFTVEETESQGQTPLVSIAPLGACHPVLVQGRGERRGGWEWSSETLW